MYSEIRSSDVSILQRLLNSANDAFLKESRITKRTTFGIIRILGAHKKLC